MVTTQVASAALAGWSGLPRGLRASADSLQARGFSIRMLPSHFVWRHAESVVPSDSGLSSSKMFRLQRVRFELLYRRFLASLPLPPAAPYTGSQPRRLITLRQEGDPEIQVIVIANTVVGSLELDRLILSVPWPVHAVAVGQRDWWASAVQDMPHALAAFAGSQLILVVDAYDMVLLPCRRSIKEEFHRFGKEVVISAETKCWPTNLPCIPCEEWYAAGSTELVACRTGKQNLNSGGYMGSATSLAHAFRWLQAKGYGDIDDQLAWRYYRRSFPHLVALDHRQRIWSTLLSSHGIWYRLNA